MANDGSVMDEDEEYPDNDLLSSTRECFLYVVSSAQEFVETRLRYLHDQQAREQAAISFIENFTTGEACRAQLEKEAEQGRRWIDRDPWKMLEGVEPLWQDNCVFGVILRALRACKDDVSAEMLKTILFDEARHLVQEADYPKAKHCWLMEPAVELTDEDIQRIAAQEFPSPSELLNKEISLLERLLVIVKECRATYFRFYDGLYFRKHDSQ